MPAHPPCLLVFRVGFQCPLQKLESFVEAVQGNRCEDYPLLALQVIRGGGDQGVGSVKCLVEAFKLQEDVGAEPEVS